MAPDPGESKQVECRGCGLTVTLPPTPGRPGFVDIEPIDGWTAPPPLCPSCSKTKPIPAAVFGSQGGSDV